MIQRATSCTTESSCWLPVNDSYLLESCCIQTTNDFINTRFVNENTDGTYILPEPQDAANTGKFFSCRSVKYRGVNYIITSHFSQETTITERIGNILSDIVTTTDYYQPEEV